MVGDQFILIMTAQQESFWQATGSNDIIGEIIHEADTEVYEKLIALLDGESFVTYIDTDVIYPQIKEIRLAFTVFSWLQVI